tara:strand:+ start:9031 stop:10074 length:1044 start_codon:yes stop_codon:yes gene_type:complete
MGVTFSGTKLPQSQLEEIQSEIYADWGTFRDRDISIEEGHKSGTDVYESKVTVNMKAASSSKVTADGTAAYEVEKSAVTNVRVMFADIVDESTLLDTRFERSMKAGAFNIVSTEFDNAVLQYITPAISERMESALWDGATTAQKAAIAALTPAAPQGSISAGAQTLASAMPTNLFNSLPATILYNDSQSKTVSGAGLGDYKKVLNIATITSATIAAQYQLLFATLDPKVLADPMNPPVIFAPLSHRQFMRTANNSVGAASNKNFDFADATLQSKVYFQGIEVKFKPLVGFILCADPRYLKLLLDLMSDISSMETGPVGEGAQQMYYKNVQSLTTWVTNQRYITLYGG